MDNPANPVTEAEVQRVLYWMEQRRTTTCAANLEYFKGETDYWWCNKGVELLRSWRAGRATLARVAEYAKQLRNVDEHAIITDITLREVAIADNLLRILAPGDDHA